MHGKIKTDGADNMKAITVEINGDDLLLPEEMKNFIGRWCWRAYSGTELTLVIYSNRVEDGAMRLAQKYGKLHGTVKIDEQDGKPLIDISPIKGRKTAGTAKALATRKGPFTLIWVWI